MNVMSKPRLRSNRRFPTQMKVRLKPLAEQVVVITGASSGIGLATARLAAQAGARVVLAARSAGVLAELEREIRAAGGTAAAVVTDVSNEAEVEALAARAIELFGGFDTWVNDAGIGMYGRLEEHAVADMRKLFDINFWGIVYGSRAALPQLKAHGGALINLGSEVSERAVPLQGTYCASKHAIKGFTEALRMELEAEGAPVSVSLIKPGQIDTPFTVNAHNELESEPQHVPPVYAPEVVARAILHCAETPARDVYVGGGARTVAALGHAAPGLTDKVMERMIIPGTPSGHRASRSHSGLQGPSEVLAERGNYPGHVMRTSAYTAARLNPVLAATLAGAGLALFGLLRRGGGSDGAARGGRAVTKAFHVTLEARPGKEAAVMDLLRELQARVGRERVTRSWYATQSGPRVFEIFDTFPSASARAVHLAGRAARLLLMRSPALFTSPPTIKPLDVLLDKHR